MKLIKACPKCGSSLVATHIATQEELMDNGDAMECCFDGEGFPLTTGRTRKVVRMRQCEYCSYVECGDEDDDDDVGPWQETTN